MEPTRIREQQIITYRGITPRLDSSVFIAPGARIIGDVAQLEQSAENYIRYVSTYSRIRS